MVVIVVGVVKVVVVVVVVVVVKVCPFTLHPSPFPLSPSPSLINKPLHNITIRINSTITHEWPVRSITVSLLCVNVNYHHLFIVM